MNDKTIYQGLGLKRVINAAGKLTVLGGSALNPEPAQAMAAAALDYVDLPELMTVAGRMIAEATGAEAGYITSCAAAGIVLATAACICRGDIQRTEALPHPGGPPDRMIIQRGHAVHFGASILQIMAMAGAQVVEIGNTNRTLPHQLAGALLDESTAGVMVVVSHYTSHAGMLPLEDVIEQAHARHVPVVVDAAAELDLQKYIAAGADLVIYSSQKGIEGPASGMIAGRKVWVEACAQQGMGIGRAMKIGKESIVGAIVALQSYTRRDTHMEFATQSIAADEMLEEISGITGLQAQRSTDEVRPIPRLRIKINSGLARMNAVQLVQALAGQDPTIRVRPVDLHAGVFEIDFRNLRPGDAREIIAALHKYLET
jgi:uncharacterized pyridoxal phosphate-dependent enzyme